MGMGRGKPRATAHRCRNKRKMQRTGRSLKRGHGSEREIISAMCHGEGKKRSDRGKGIERARRKMEDWRGREVDGHTLAHTDTHTFHN